MSGLCDWKNYKHIQFLLFFGELYEEMIEWHWKLLHRIAQWILPFSWLFIMCLLSIHHWCHANMPLKMCCKWRISVRPYWRVVRLCIAQSFVKMDKDSFLLTIIIEILYATDEINYFLSDIFNAITGLSSMENGIIIIKFRKWNKRMNGRLFKLKWNKITKKKEQRICCTLKPCRVHIY